MENADKKELNVVKEYEDSENYSYDDSYDCEDSIENTTGKKPKKAKKVKKSKYNPDGTKRKRQPVRTSFCVLICVGLGVLGTTLGCVGGYFLYTLLLPAPSYVSYFTDYAAIRKRVEQSKNKNLLKEFEGEEYQIVNYALDKFTTYKNTLAMGFGEVHTLNGDQTVRAVTIGGGGKAYNQNISSTGADAFVNVGTAYRFYYDLTNPTKPTINAYEKEYETEWTSEMAETNVYEPDAFIKKYGKLNLGKYTVADDDKFISTEEIPNGNLVNGVSIYQITKESVAAVNECRKDGDKYRISITLDTEAACSYYAAQVKTNGGLDEVYFDQFLDYDFVLDKDFNLVESFVSEAYQIKMGILANCEATMHTQYFYTNDDELIVEGEKIEIPEKGKQFPLDTVRASKNKKDKGFGKIVKYGEK